MYDTIIDNLRTSVVEVFKVAASSHLKDDDVANPFNGEMLVASSIGFTGSLSGSVYLTVGATTAKTVTSRILGLEECEVDGGMVSDAMGEVANMVVGSMKSKLSSHGAQLVMTVPTVVDGREIEIEQTRFCNKFTYVYRLEQEPVRVDFLLKGE